MRASWEAHEPSPPMPHTEASCQIFLRPIPQEAGAGCNNLLKRTKERKKTHK